MRCYWLLRSLRKAAFGGALTALGMFSAAQLQAAVVGPDLPSWMASPVSMKVSDYPLGEETEKEPLPWFSPAEGYEPYGANYIDYGFESEDLSQIETPLRSEYEADNGAMTEEFDADATNGDEGFEYQYGYRDGFDADDARPYDHYSPEDAADRGSEYRYYVPEESAFGNDYESGEADDMDAEINEQSAYEHRYPTEHGGTPAETQAVDQNGDYDYSYGYTPRYEKYGRWMEPANDEQSESNGESDSYGDEADDGYSAMESDDDNGGDDAASEMNGPYETDSEAYGEGYADSYSDGYAESMGDETSQYEHDAQDGEFCPVRDEMNSDDDTDAADPYRDEPTYDPWQPSKREYEYDDEGSSQQNWADEETAMSRTDSADATTEFPYVLRDSGWRRAYSGEHADPGFREERTSWTPDNLLTESDSELIRNLALAYEEPLETRYAMLNDYVEMLGWEALKLAERFEDSTGIEFLGLTEDLSGLAAVLSVFRATQQGAMSLDHGVDLLCHGFGQLDQNWLDTVARLCTEGTTSGWVSGDNPADSWESESYRGMIDQSDDSDSFQSDSGDSFGADASRAGALLIWFEQERNNWHVAFRNTMQQFRNIDLGWLLAPSAEYEPVIGSEYESDYRDYDDCSDYDD